MLGDRSFVCLYTMQLLTNSLAFEAIFSEKLVIKTKRAEILVLTLGGGGGPRW